MWQPKWRTTDILPAAISTSAIGFDDNDYDGYSSDNEFGVFRFLWTRSYNTGCFVAIEEAASDINFRFRLFRSSLSRIFLQRLLD